MLSFTVYFRVSYITDWVLIVQFFLCVQCDGCIDWILSPVSAAYIDVRNKSFEDPQSVVLRDTVVGHICCLAWWWSGQDCRSCFSVWFASPQGHWERSLRQSFWDGYLRLQWLVLRQKMMVCWCRGNWWSASWFGLYPPVLLWKMAFFLLWIRVLTSLKDRCDWSCSFSLPSFASWPAISLPSEVCIWCKSTMGMVAGSGLNK